MYWSWNFPLISCIHISFTSVLSVRKLVSHKIISVLIFLYLYHSWMQSLFGFFLCFLYSVSSICTPKQTFQVFAVPLSSYYISLLFSYSLTFIILAVRPPVVLPLLCTSLSLSSGSLFSLPSDSASTHSLQPSFPSLSLYPGFLTPSNTQLLSTFCFGSSVFAGGSAGHRLNLISGY